MDGSWWRGLTECGPLDKGMANHFTILALRTPWTVWKSKKLGHWKITPQVGRCPICYWNRWRTNSRKMKRLSQGKKKKHPVVDVAGDRSKVQCYKKHYCIRTWNVMSMNQGKLDVVKQEMSRVKVDILEISKLKWTGEFNSDDHYIYYCGQESLRRNRVAIMVNKRVRSVVLGYIVKNGRMISVPFQGKQSISR